MTVNSGGQLRDHCQLVTVNRPLDKWWPVAESHRATPRLQRGAHHCESLRAKLVLPRGAAPRSVAHRATALLLSYGRKLAEREGLAPPTPKFGATVFKTASSSGRTRSAKLAPEAGLAPATLRLTAGGTTVVLLGNEVGLPGRTPTCNLSDRSRWLCVFELRGDLEWLMVHGLWQTKVGRAPRFCPECLPVPSRVDCYLPRARENGGRDGCRPRCLLLDRQASLLFLFATENWCAVQVTLLPGPQTTALQAVSSL